MRERLKAARLFVDFFMFPQHVVTHSNELKFTKEFIAAEEKFPLIFFYGFMKSFMVILLTELIIVLDARFP